jgi:hypothetical protein
METPATASVSGAPEFPPIFTSAIGQPVGADDLAAILRAAEAARVLQGALHAAGLDRIAAHVTTGRVAPKVWLLPLEPADARELAALIDRSLLPSKG